MYFCKMKKVLSILLFSLSTTIFALPFNFDNQSITDLKLIASSHAECMVNKPVGDINLPQQGLVSIDMNIDQCGVETTLDVYNTYKATFAKGWAFIFTIWLTKHPDLHTGCREYHDIYLCYDLTTNPEFPRSFRLSIEPETLTIKKGE